MAKRRRKAQAEAAEENTAQEQEDERQFEVLDSKAILDEECEEEDGKRFVSLTPSRARTYTDHGVRLQEVQEQE